MEKLFIIDNELDSDVLDLIDEISFMIHFRRFNNCEGLQRVIEKEEKDIVYCNDNRVYVKRLPRLAIYNKQYVTIKDNNVYRFDFVDNEWVKVYG